MAKPKPVKKPAAKKSSKDVRKDPKKDLTKDPNKKDLGKKDLKKKEEEVKKPLPPSPYSASELKEFKALLGEMKRRLSGDVEKLEDAGFRKQDGGDLSSMPLHMADQGTDSFEQDITLGLMESESDELQEIEEALERIKNGHYGVCELCMKSIPKARLQAIPYARLCVACKSKEEGS